MLGQEKLELDNLTVCDKFKPTILEGQLCYSLDVARLKRKPTKSGDRNGLFLLVDPNPYRGNFSESNDRNGEDSFKIYIHTLAQHTAFGPGSYGMDSLKKMIGTKSFEELPESQKRCRVHDQEECRTGKFLEQVKGNCSCIPWALANTTSKEKVIPDQ